MFFLRKPDQAGFAYWNGVAEPIWFIADQFALSSEFERTHGPLDDSALMSLIYRNVLDRPEAVGGV